MNKKALHIIMGAAAIVLGILCAVDPKLAVVLAGIGLLIYGFGGFFRWRERAKAGAASVWPLGGMLVAVGFGIFILIGGRVGESAARFLLISLSIWLMAEGVLEFLGGVMYRKAMTTADLGVQAPGSLLAMGLGVVMIAVGVLGLIFPVFAAFAVWAWIVVELILTGVRLIVQARSAGALEEADEPDEVRVPKEADA